VASVAVVVAGVGVLVVGLYSFLRPWVWGVADAVARMNHERMQQEERGSGRRLPRMICSCCASCESRAVRVCRPHAPVQCNT